MKELSDRLRKHTAFVSCLLVLAVCFFLMPLQTLAQTSSSSFSQLLTQRMRRVQASFTYSPTYPTAGQAVQFTDSTANGPTSWQWTFGDGATSTAQNPSHAFTKPGFYKVSLTAANSLGSRTRTRTITVMPSVGAASFTYSPGSPRAGNAVQFTDTSTNGPTSWQWHFGDGTTSSTKNPSHTYGAPASYTVTLDAANGSGAKTASQTLTVSPASTPTVSFTFSPASPAAGQSVQFTDTSTGSPTSWLWNFGDGATSAAQNPSHTFATAASYTVTLTATNSSGSQSVNRTVTVVAALSASFTFSPASPAAGQAVQFTDISAGSPTSWRWNFGDGTSSTSQNPSHTYASPASYTITLTATNSSGSQSVTRTVTVVPALTASFTYSPASPAVGQTVQFTDTSTGSPTSWQWDFGDGTSATSQNPSHAYAATGSYLVTLTIRTASNLNSTSKTISVGQTLTASFTYSPASPVAGQAVQFTDASTGSPTSWQWSFGDNGTSTSRNPSHTFTKAGSYTVTLTATNGSGSQSVSRTVSVAPAASFTYTPSSPVAGQAVQFTDTSTGSPTSWQWSFGDGATSTAQNPSHTFTAVASYTVTLTVSGSGSNSTSQTINVSPATTLMASFTFSPSSPNPGQAVQFTDASTGSPTSWQWSFGDGATSTAQNPSHTFTVADLYTVTLTVANTSGSNSVSRTVSVTPSTSSILPPDRVIDWSKAGVWDVRYNTKGIPNYPVGINLTGLTSYGGYPLDNTGAVSSAAAINAALNACSTYHAVLLGPGSYLATGINIPSYRVLRGSGPFVTIILQDPSSTSHCINLNSNRSYGTAVNIVGAAVKGSDTVTVDTTTGVSVGDLVLVDQLNDPSFVTIAGSEDTCTYCSRNSGTRALGETKYVVAINAGAKTIQFERPVYYGYETEWTAQVIRVVSAASVKKNAGVENLSIHMTASINGSWDVDTGHAIHAEGSLYCWAKDIEIYNHPRTGVGVVYYTVGFQLSRSYIHDTWPGKSTSGNYGVGIRYHATDSLIEDNIIIHNHSQVVIGAGGGNGNVVAYNFFENGRYDGSPGWWTAGTGTHGAHTYMNLWEGNLNQKISHDNIHGSGSHQFWFRNRVTGYAYPLDGTKTMELTTVNIPYENPYMCLVANILGTDGYDTIYETYPCSLSAKQIYKLGTDGIGSTGGQHTPNDVSPTILRHGNYNYVTHDTIWDAGISDHTLPNSMYLTAKPAFFGGLSWPAFGPDLNPMESYIPAKYRFDAGTYFADPPIK